MCSTFVYVKSLLLWSAPYAESNLQIKMWNIKTLIVFTFVVNVKKYM